ncbi:MAG: ABC transporter permease [Proteobacteria bacterium]|nr:ABC transporter permease [Pseudomonadota bacterium]
MFILTIKEALRSLTSNKLQTILALLGITIGVAAVVCMISVGESAKEKALAGLKALGTDIITGSEQQAGKEKVKGLQDKYILKAEDVQKMVNENNIITSVAARIDGFASVGREGVFRDVTVLGITGSFNSINKLKIKFGRKIEEFDMEQNYCVLGYELASQIFGKAGRGGIIGKDVYVKRHKFTVIGVYEKLEYKLTDNFNEAMFIPIQKAAIVFETKKLTNFKAKIREDYPTEKAKAKLISYFTRRTNLSMNLDTQEMLIKQAEEQSKTASKTLIATAAISLIVGGIGIMNLMLISIKERRREIGIRRSCGADRMVIMIQILSESVFLSLIGGTAGIIIGVISSLGIAVVANWKTIIPVTSIFLSFFVSMAIGVIFGYIPARNAAKMEIIDALRME